MISVIGLGPGALKYLTPLAQQRILDSTYIVGAQRHLAAISELITDKPHHGRIYKGKLRLLDPHLADLVSWLSAQTLAKPSTTSNIVVLASGDPMLYGIGRYLSRQLGLKQVEIVTGISAIQYLFSRVGLDMNETYLTSTHGKRDYFFKNINFILQHEKIALVTDATTGAYDIAQYLIEKKITRTFIVGENLSYPNEKINYFTEQTVSRTDQLNTVIILKEPHHEG